MVSVQLNHTFAQIELQTKIKKIVFRLTKIQYVYIREAFVAIASTIDNKLRLYEVAGVVTPGDRDLASGFDLFPSHFRQIEFVGVVESLDTIASSKNIDAVVVDASGVRATATWSIANSLWVAPR